MLKRETFSKRLLATVLLIAMLHTNVMSLNFAQTVFAAATNYISVDDSIIVNTGMRSASQTGKVNFNAWTSSNISTLSGVGSGTSFDQINWKQNEMSEFKDNIQFEPSTFDFSQQPIVIEMRYKIKLDNYTTAEKPSTKVFLNFTDNLVGGMYVGGTGTPTAATENSWQTVKVVVDPSTKKVYRNYNGSDFIATGFTNTTATSFTGLRIYTMAIPGAATKVDGTTPLESPVTWTFDYIKVYGAPREEVLPADSVNYMVKLTNQMSYNPTNFDTTQEGTLHYRRANADLSGFSPIGSLYDQLKLKMSIMNDWKDMFYLSAADYATSKYTVIDMKFKVNLDDYTLATKPSVNIRLVNNSGAFQIEGMPKFVPQEADKDTWQNLRFVIDPATGKTYASYNGAAYTSTAMTVPATGFYAGDVRIFPVAVPGGATKVDGSTVLETPVTWYVDSFSTYQETGTIPSPTGAPTISPTPTASPSEDVPYMVELTDKMIYNPSDFTTTQNGALYYRRVSANLSGYMQTASYYDQLKIDMLTMSDWTNLFYLPGANYSSTKKTVIDMKYRVTLDDYSLAVKPSVGMRLYNNKGAFQIEAMPKFVPTEADKDTWYTVRFVIDPITNKAYASFNGAAYTTASVTGTSLANYDGEIRIYPEAIPGGTTKVDNVTALETPVRWYIDSFTSCQFDGNLPGPTERPKQLPTPSASPAPSASVAPTPSPLPADLAALIVKTYPQGKMKAAIMDFDDGADWCKDSDQAAIAMFNTYGVKAGFNLVPGICTAGFLAGVKSMYAGHEVTSHSLTHPQLQDVSDSQFLTEVRESKRILETAIGGEVPGFVYPYGYTPTADRLNTIKLEGYRYARSALSNGTLVMPNNFYNWNPTIHLVAGQDISGTQTKFDNLDASTEMRLLFAWAHAWEYKANATTGAPESWNVLEDWCKYLVANKATIWNPTPIELVDYVNATRYLEIKYNANHDIEITNPSATIDTWVKVAGILKLIPKASTVVIPRIPTKEFVPSKYLVNVNDNFDFTLGADGSKSMSELGTVTYRWGKGLVTPIDQVGTKYKQVEIKQSIMNEYVDHILVSNPSAYDTSKPIVVDVKYKVKLGSYTGSLPKGELGLQIQGLGLYSNQTGMGTGKITPSAADQDTYRTIKYVIDKKTNKIYCSNNGGAFTAYTVTGTFPTSITDLRLYIKAFPFNTSGAQDNVTELETPVTWTLDSFKVYQIEDSDKIQVSAISVSKDASDANKINYTVNAKNYDTVASDFVVMVALYDNSKAAPKLVGTTMKTVSALASNTSDGTTGSFNVTGLTNYSVKAIVWNSKQQIMPYDVEVITKAQVQ